jgi:hypothetical protein
LSFVATFAPVFSRLESTHLAHTIGGSLMLTAGLSAVHMLGFTLVMSGALLADLRLLGIALRGRPALEVVIPAGRVIVAGLIVSLVTGVLLFSPKATSAAENVIFQLKMLLLVGAALFHFIALRQAVRREGPGTAWSRGVGGVGLALWLGLALAACAFILLE